MTMVLVAGTGTDVGKTWVTAEVARRLRDAGVAVAARKPVQSFAAGDARTDADLLAAATGETASTICPLHRWLPTPMAPPMAAAALGRESFTIAELVAELHPPADGVVFIESAGGVRSPLAADGDTVALADACSPTLVVLVADAGLGTISSVRLSHDALRPRPTVVYLNRFGAQIDLHSRNLDWLRRREGLEVITDPEALATYVRRVATR
ncbi:MAG: ATP-dependent dethiobiotin synthetase BioD [Actinomycetota bacterium]